MSLSVNFTPSTSLTHNGILSLFKLELSKQNFDTSSLLQIVHLKKNEVNQQINNNNNEMYTACLTDEDYSYNRFVFYKEVEQPELKEGQIVLIKKICPMKLGKHPERVFLIKEYEQLDKIEEIRNKPIIKDNPLSLQELFNNMNDNFPSSSIPSLTNINSNATPSHSSMYTPIKNITTFTKDFLIYGKVSYKSDVKKFVGKKCSQLFSFIVEDEEGSSIEFVCFDKAVDNFNNIIKEGSMYEISGGYIKLNEKKYGKGKQTEYKIVLNENSNIIKKKDGPLPKMDYTSLSEIFKLPTNTIINVICIVYESKEITIKKTKIGDMEMKTVTILDDTNKLIELSLWRDFARKEFNKGDILILYKVRVSDFNGRNLNSFKDTRIEINPTIEDSSIKEKVSSIRLCLEVLVAENQVTNGNNNEDSSISFPLNINEEVGTGNKKNNQPYNQNYNKENNRPSNQFNFTKKNLKEPFTELTYIKTILDKMDENPNLPRQTIFKIKATISKLSHNDKNFYPGCSNGECQKKLTQESNHWRCTGCYKEYDRANYFYSLNIKVKDCSCEYWIDLFGKTAEFLMQKNPNQYRNLLLEQNEEALMEISNRVEFEEYYFYIKTRFNSYNGVTKKKLTVTKIERVNTKQMAYHRLEKLKEILFPPSEENKEGDEKE